MKKTIIYSTIILFLLVTACSDSPAKTETTIENSATKEKEPVSAGVDTIKKTNISIGPNGAAVTNKSTEVIVDKNGVNVGTKNVKVVIKK